MIENINNLLKIIENRHINSKILFIIIITLIFDITLRHILEINLIDTQNITNPNNNYLTYIHDEIKFFYENFSYFILLFLGMNFFVSLVLKETISKMFNFSVYFYPFIIIPPLLDYYIFHSLFEIKYVEKFIEFGYSYGSIGQYLNNIMTLSWNTGDTSYGISLLVTIGVLTSSFYVYIRSDKFKLIKAIFTFIVIDVMIMTISTPDLFFGNRESHYRNTNLLPLFYYIPILFSVYIISFYEKLLNKELQILGIVYFISITILYFNNTLFDFYLINISILLVIILITHIFMFIKKSYYSLNFNILISFILSGFLLEFTIYVYLLFMLFSLILFISFLLLNPIQKS